jgi:nucleoside-diphosphate-sugar epimerase
VKALVTGAGGFVGGAIARALQDRGDEVRGFSRGEHTKLADYGIEQYQGDVWDPEAVTEAMRGVNIVFHAAAKVGAGGRYADFHATNVTGTANVIAACRECGVLALVFTSTPSVVTGLEDLENADESVSYPKQYDSHYSHTKAEAERLVLSSASDELKTIALRPPLIWGPGDTSLLPRVMARARKGSLRRIEGPPKLTDITYIDDAVQAHLHAADRLLLGDDGAQGINGRPYFVSSGEPVEIWEFVNALLDANGIAPVEKSTSLRRAMAMAWLFEKIHALLRAKGEPRMNRWMVRQLTTSRWFDISAARQDLAYEPRVSMEDGMRRLKVWVLDLDPDDEEEQQDQEDQENPEDQETPEDQEDPDQEDPDRA